MRRLTVWVRSLRVAAGRAMLGRRILRALPREVGAMAARLAGAGHEVCLVGGCVRDLVWGVSPKDWDLATSADAGAIMVLLPEGRQIGAARGGGGPDGAGLTVLVQAGGVAYEITPYRGGSLAQDLSHRDFTLNAMAVRLFGGRELAGAFTDPEGGCRDLAMGCLRACGLPEDRIREDPLRMLRAIRLAAQFDFVVEPGLYRAMSQLAPLLAQVATERIGAEFGRLLVTGHPARAVEQLRETGLLAQFAPELLEMVGVQQNQFHAYPVWEHALLALEAAPPELHLRLAALLHDVAKPRCLSVDEAGERHFYGHETVGADMASRLLEWLRFDLKTQKRVVHLVRHHMDLHLGEEASDAALRRMVGRIGLEHMDDLIQLRRADRMAAGTRVGELSQENVALLKRVARVLESDAALQVSDLAVNGYDVIAAFGRAPGPWVGRVLAQLLDEVLEEPGLNTRERLLARLAELAQV